MIDMFEAVRAEVEEQHRLLAGWLGSDAEPVVLDRLRDAHTEDFSIVTTDGQVLGRAALLAGLATAGNARPGLRIRISDVTVLAELDEAVLARFLETHVEHGHASRRRTSALLRREPGARNGLRWWSVHETALP